MIDRTAERSKRASGERTGQAELQLRELEANFRFKIRVVDGAFSFLRTAARCSAWVVALYVTGLGLAPFAGKNTAVVALVRSMIEFRADRYILGIVSALTGGCWWRERRKRLRLIQEWGPYIKELEEKVTPDRSSSGLQINGRPTKEDADAL